MVHGLIIEFFICRIIEVLDFSLVKKTSSLNSMFIVENLNDIKLLITCCHKQIYFFVVL